VQWNLFNVKNDEFSESALRTRRAPICPIRSGIAAAIRRIDHSRDNRGHWYLSERHEARSWGSGDKKPGDPGIIYGLPRDASLSPARGAGGGWGGGGGGKGREGKGVPGCSGIATNYYLAKVGYTRYLFTGGIRPGG